jgi:predicted SnoaL-like aldol condensation-catalyzing enzyme
LTTTDAETPGKKFFDEHMKYIMAGDVDGMIDNQYAEDAILISPFDILDTQPPHIVKGRQALKDFFNKYLPWQGEINVESLYDFAELPDSIVFHAIFTSHTGRWVVGDFWHMKDGLIDRHYSFAHKLADA